MVATYYPPPTGITSLDAPLVVDTTLTFGVGAAADRVAKLVADFADITYDMVETASVDVGVTATGNDISAPAATSLVTLFKPAYDPAHAYLIGMLLTCEYGEAAIYLATDVALSTYFDPPGMDSYVPVPLIPGGWFLYVNDHEYESATWQTVVSSRVYVGEVLAATFKPSRITGYFFFKNFGV